MRRWSGSFAGRSQASCCLLTKVDITRPRTGLSECVFLCIIGSLVSATPLFLLYIYIYTHIHAYVGSRRHLKRSMAAAGVEPEQQ